jgi:hypothetical protein
MKQSGPTGANPPGLSPEPHHGPRGRAGSNFDDDRRYHKAGRNPAPIARASDVRRDRRIVRPVTAAHPEMGQGIPRCQGPAAQEAMGCGAQEMCEPAENREDITMTRSDGERCPGGYLIRGGRLCGTVGNNCRDTCAFEYRRHEAAIAEHLAAHDKKIADRTKARHRRQGANKRRGLAAAVEALSRAQAKR